MIPAPFRAPPIVVRPEWIDENGHMNVAYYVVVFDKATDLLWSPIGLGDAYRATGHGTFAVESHILYRAELVEGEQVEVTTQILGLDHKRIHLAHEMRRVRDGAVAAQQEFMLLAVNLTTRRAAPFLPEVMPGLLAAAQAHAALPRPEWVGRRLALPTPT